MKVNIKCDLHMHSQFSDGKLTIKELVDYFGSRGYGAIAITDHLCEKNNLVGKVSHGLQLTLSEETFSIYMETIKEEAARAFAEYQMLLIPGFEITKNSFSNHRSAHILILGIEKFINPELSVEEILTCAKSYGALTVAAHPFHTGDLEFQTFHLWAKRHELAHLVDAWEVNYRLKISSEVLQSRLPLIANSDFHHFGHFKSWKTKVYTEKNQENLFRSIRNQSLDFFVEDR